MNEHCFPTCRKDLFLESAGENFLIHKIQERKIIGTTSHENLIELTVTQIF